MGGGGRGMRVVRDAGQAGRGGRVGPAGGRGGVRRSPTCSWKSSSSGPSTSRCSCSATGTAGWSTCSSGTARSSGGTRRWSNWPRPRTSTGRRAARHPRRRPRRRPGGRHRQRQHRRVPGRHRRRSGSTSSRSTRASRSSTPSPRWSPGTTSCKSQILIAQGLPLDRPGDRPRRPGRDHAPTGYAIQCRVTTEDPANGFVPGLRPAHAPTARPAGRASGSTPARAFGGAVITPVLRLAAGEGDGQRPPVRWTPPGGWSGACRSSASAA